MRKITLFACVALLAFAGAARADSTAIVARALLEEHKHAVVTLQMVINLKMPMSEPRESKAEATGTVISPEGLTVLALSSTDPTSLFRNMMSGMGDQFRMEAELTDMKILLHDGTEIPAHIVLRDNDMDLAFVQPRERPETAMAYVDTSDPGQPRMLDKVVAINRLGRVANRVYSASYEHIQAIVDRPRTFYIPGSSPTHTAQGSPAFMLDGKFVGIFVIRTVRDTDGGFGRFMGAPDNMVPILLPAADILEGAQQAPGFDDETEEEAPEDDATPAEDEEDEEEEVAEEDVAEDENETLESEE